MTTEEILKILHQDIHTVIMAVNDEEGHPITCAVDIMLIRKEKLFFLTARGKSLYRRLTSQNYIACTGIKGVDTLSRCAISLRGKIRGIGNRLLEEILEENPYMKKLYPNQIAQEQLEVFELYEYEGEFFDLSQTPLYRTSFSVGRQKVEHGYFIQNSCVGCGSCAKICPQSCIDTRQTPYVIIQERCLHCGACQKYCAHQVISCR